MFEILYRFFLQKRPTFDLVSWLHLPINKKTIIHYLLNKSLLSPFTLVFPVLFTPLSFNKIAPEYGIAAAFSFLFTLFLISITLHWFILWVRHISLRKNWVNILFPVVVLAFFALAYFNIFILGEYTRPFFDATLTSVWPLLGTLITGSFFYFLNLRNYSQNAYLSDEKASGFIDLSSGFTGLFSRFGLAGELAETELRLILRHKKSRSYFIISIVTLLYGLFFYPRLDSFAQSWQDIYAFMLFLGIFISGAFFIQYGQLLISWNSANFDFYLNRHGGIKAILRGKWLLFVAISALFYLVSLPYAYYGLEIAALHTVGFLYNVGIGIHAIMFIALWEPKPMDINKSVFFNYEGVGVAQFLIMIPYLFIPYAIYLPLAFFFNPATGLAVLTILSVIAIAFNDRLLELSARRLHRNRYRVAASFRSEI